MLRWFVKRLVMKRPAAEDEASVTLRRMDKKTAEISTELAQLEGRIDPLKAMVERMRVEDFWK